MNEIVEYRKNSINMIHLNKIWLIAIIFIVTILIVLSNIITYNVYYQNVGNIIENNKLSMLVLNEDLNKVLKNEKLIIEKENFAYKIDEIENSTLYDNVMYKKITLDLNLNKKQNIINNVFDIKILLKKETIFKYIFRKIGGIS